MISPHRLNMGLALFAICLSAAIAAPAQTYTTVVANGLSPYGAPVQGIDGNLYVSDQTDCSLLDQGGRIAKVTPEGTVTTVHTFVGEDGKCPSGLVVETNGNLYGTTQEGGVLQASCPTPGVGCGTVFGFTPTGERFTLHSFSGTDGMSPVGLTVGPDGSTLYGTTSGAGFETKNGFLFGTIFKITPTGTFTSLHTFQNTDGALPGPLVLGTDGNLYGITQGGGTYFGGTVFKITPDGTFSTLYNFNRATEGNGPTGALVQGADGNFYGTNFSSPETCDGVTNVGTIFSISPGGHIFQTFYDFTKNCLKGINPYGGLVLGPDGNFYGFASGLGGNNGSAPEDAVFFQLTPKGVLTDLYTLGYPAYSLLMQHTNGTFYGINQFCDYQSCPSLYSFSTGLSPFVTAVPAYRGIGAKVLLLGQGFTGATSVIFNGIPATFTVNSDTEITTTVPTGATKGYIQVVTPSGTVSTKVFFTVG